LDNTAGFMAERERLLRIATGILRDPAEAEDVVQQAWIRLSTTDSIESIPAWLTNCHNQVMPGQIARSGPFAGRGGSPSNR